jgi:segregation and condensation protein B
MNKNITKLLTAILLLSDGPENKEDICSKLGITIEELRVSIDGINNNLDENNFGFYIKETSKDMDINVVPDVIKNISKYIPESILRGLSAPAMETLAVIAYEQPVTKLKISDIRGVDSDSSIKTLESRGLIEKTGEVKLPGGAVLYTTTFLFMQKMGLGSIEDLPRIGALFREQEEE